MADRAEQELGHFDHPDGSYSSVNVDAVDLDKYPDFAKIKFYNATIEAGDCVFIPSFWPHTVKSFGRYCVSLFIFACQLFLLQTA